MKNIDQAMSSQRMPLSDEEEKKIKEKVKKRID